MDSQTLFSKGYIGSERLNQLLEKIVGDIHAFAEKVTAQVLKLNQIGIALSAERNLDRLLEMIVDEARNLTNADGGTLYTVEGDVLKFQIVQNASMGIRMGGTTGIPIPWPPVPLGKANVSAYVALTGEIVNIPDVYEAQGFDFSGTRRYDAHNHYRSKSMLVVPMRNHEEEIIGVLQLINAQDPETGEIVEFLPEHVNLVASLASQAAVAITNARLIQDLEQLFEALIEVLAKAVDEKSPYTAGHITRVTEYAYALAQALNEEVLQKEGKPLFTTDQLRELRIAGLLHDIGKITTPEWVIDKAKKLEKIFDRIELVEERFKKAKALAKARALEQELRLLEKGAPLQEIRCLEESLERELLQYDQDLEFVRECNEPGEFLSDDRIERLKEIARKTYLDEDGQEKPLLTEDELKNLSIRKGSITWEELQVMRHHVVVTQRMLDKIPFTKRLKNVPLYAGQHHEMLDGSGYPLGLKGDQLPLQSRILAIADVFDALSAKDRPYKKAFPLETVVSILQKDASQGKLDPHLVQLFIERRIWERVPSEGSPEGVQPPVGEKLPVSEKTA